MILFDIVKEKTDIRGYWKQGKTLFKDNIVLLDFENPLIIESIKEKLFTFKNQLAIFFKEGDKAYIESNIGNVQELAKVTRLYFEKITPSLFKKLLKEYNGFTVYKRKSYYMLEIWEA